MFRLRSLRNKISTLTSTMVRRARTTFGKPKKRTASRKSRDSDNDTPSESKWATMASYGSFVGEYFNNLSNHFLTFFLYLFNIISSLNGDVTCNKSTILMESNSPLPKKIGMFYSSWTTVSLMLACMADCVGLVQL
jgi:hypothetical protein